MQKIGLALPAAAVAVAASLALAVSPVSADEATTVTVRVEGESATLLAPTLVTTTGATVVKDGNSEHSCSGYDAIGALEIATGGDWAGSWYGGEFGYGWGTILGESHIFPGSSYWAFWHNDVYSEKGICEASLQSGDTLLFAPASAEGAPAPEPLGLQAPAEATVGQAVPVTALAYANATGTPAPAAGATIAYEGKTVEADAAGHATLAFSRPGTQKLGVSKAGAVRDEASICVRSAGEATCGAGDSPGTGVAGFTSSAPYKGPYALVAGVTSLANGRTYGHGAAPRLIAGRISSHSPVTSVSLALRRSFHGRCFAFDGARGRFSRARCGSAAFFQVSKEAAFTYLLPATLPPGRYVLDLRAGDTAGNTLTLARGTSRLVFHVR